MKWTDYVMLLGKDSSHLQIFLDPLKFSVGIFDVRFSPSKFKMLLQDYICSKSSFVSAGKQLN